MTTNQDPTTDPRCAKSPAPYVIYLDGGCVSQSRIDTLTEMRAYEQQNQQDYTAPDGGLVVLICLPVLLALLWLNRK